jgi:hypothetical protein
LSRKARATYHTCLARSNPVASHDGGLRAYLSVECVFTINSRREKTDPAIRRPDRLDVILHFQPPCSVLRGQLIATRRRADSRNELLGSGVIWETEGST